MERLTGIVKILRKGEKRLLRHLYSTKTNGEDPLRLELFNLIEAGKVTTDEEALNALGKQQGSSAFSHLKTRLREDILNVLLLQESSKRIAQANRAAAFECRKKLAQAYVLIFRGAFQEGMEVLKGAKITADKFELVAELVLINHLIREVVHLIKDVKQLHQINASINSNLDKWKDILRSEEISLMMTLPHLYKETGDSDGRLLNQDRIKELGQLFEKSGSARIGFWYFLAFIEQANTQSRFSEAIEAGMEFIQLVESNPSIWSKNNMAGANQMLGTAYLNVRDYVNGVAHFTNADQNFPIAGNNRLANLELLLRAQLGAGDLIAALKTVAAALAHPRVKAKSDTMPRWYFFQACVQLLSGEIDGAFRSINREGYLTKQRDDWNVQFRLLEIMVMVEQKDEEWIDFRIQTLRKFLARNRKLATPRVKASIEIISAILRKGLEFDTLGNKAEQALQQCLAEVPGFEWNPEGSEVVRIDRWVEQKRMTGSGKKRVIRD